jgi:hypothetical protein
MSYNTRRTLWTLAALAVPCLLLMIMNVLLKSFHVRLPDVDERTGYVMLAMPGLACLIPVLRRYTVLAAPLYIIAMWYLLRVVGLYCVGYVYDDWP